MFDLFFVLMMLTLSISVFESLLELELKMDRFLTNLGSCALKARNHFPLCWTNAFLSVEETFLGSPPKRHHLVGKKELSGQSL
jgi:hypothetical protein